MMQQMTNAGIRFFSAERRAQRQMDMEIRRNHKENWKWKKLDDIRKLLPFTYEKSKKCGSVSDFIIVLLNFSFFFDGTSILRFNTIVHLIICMQFNKLTKLNDIAVFIKVLAYFKLILNAESANYQIELKKTVFHNYYTRMFMTGRNFKHLGCKHFRFHFMSVYTYVD